jgi:subtilisin family serine protease
MPLLSRVLGLLLALQLGVAAAADRGLAAFRDSVDGNIVPATIILKTPATAAAAASPASLADLKRYSLDLWAEQDRFLDQVLLRDLRLLPRVADVPQIDGSIRTVHWRYTYLMNGFTAWVAEADLARLRAQPEVAAVYLEDGEIRYFVDRAVDYVLGTQPDLSERRRAVYGNTEELDPVGSAGHPETPATLALDGVEGQDINVAVIDSGVDWRHPMFGGSGQDTPLPTTPRSSTTFRWARPATPPMISATAPWWRPIPPAFASTATPRRRSASASGPMAWVPGPRPTARPCTAPRRSHG